LKGIAIEGPDAPGFGMGNMGFIFPDRDLLLRQAMLDGNGGIEYAPDFSHTYPMKHILTELDVKELRDGKAYLAIYGTVMWFDIFDVPHEMNFCRWKVFKNFGDGEKPIDITACARHNDTDNNTNPVKLLPIGYT
jgi:hypothetical protein